MKKIPLIGFVLLVINYANAQPFKPPLRNVNRWTLSGKMTACKSGSVHVITQSPLTKIERGTIDQYKKWTDRALGRL